MTADEYLHTSFEYEPDYVHGELIERQEPTLSRGAALLRLGVPLDRIGDAYINLTMKLTEDLYRIADIALYRTPPARDFPDNPPFLVVEIISAGDDVSRSLRKLSDFRAWGVDTTWFVQSAEKRLFAYNGELREVPAFELPEFNLTITPDQLFA